MKLGTPVVRQGRVDSTMAAARRGVEAGTAATGAVFVADEQTAGRGRHGRSWLSAPGRGLYLTAVLPAALRDPAVTLAGALAVADAVESSWGHAARLKWPNDVLVDGRKLAGVLAEVVAARGGDRVLLGIGLNLSHGATELAELGVPATSVALLTGEEPDVEAALAAVLRALGRRLDEFHRGGFPALAPDWTSRSELRPGDILEVEEGAGVATLTCQGLDERGRLRTAERSHALSSAVILRVRQGAAAPGARR